MNIVGLITEYNPFHKGHEYHIQKAKELTGADACVVIMSGNYVQRGTPAFIDKHTRTSIALNHGADIVFELPLPFSCSSAEYFATAAVTLLDKMGIVNYICFGSECPDIDKLDIIATTLADAKVNQEHPINHLIKTRLKSGISYAVARSTALSEYLSNDYSDILDMPNNILAIEYLKTLKMLKSKIKPISITRTNATYHHDDNNNSLYSASSLRTAITVQSDNSIINELYEFDPIYGETLEKIAPVYENDFSHLIGEKLLNASIYNPCNISLDEYMGIDNDLANRLISKDILYSYTSYTDLIEQLKTKNIAYTSISRAILAITLGIKKDHITSYVDNGIASYIRLLGFNKCSSSLLNDIKKNGSLTIIGQLSEINDNTNLSDLDRHMLSHSIYCDELYNLIVRTKYRVNIPNEYQRRMIIK